MKKTWMRMISVLLLMGMLASVLSGILPQAAAAGAQKVNLKINTQHCTVYYNEKISGQEWSHQLLKAESDIIRTGMEWPYGIVLFLAPEEGYALSKFMAGNTAGNYYPISDGQEDGTGCTFLSRREHLPTVRSQAAVPTPMCSPTPGIIPM